MNRGQNTIHRVIYTTAQFSLFGRISNDVKKNEMEENLTQLKEADQKHRFLIFLVKLIFLCFLVNATIPFSPKAQYETLLKLTKLTYAEV